MSRRISLQNIHKILIVNLGGVGDILLSLPALRALKKRYPTAKIVFLGVPRTCGVARDFSIFDEVLAVASYEDRTPTFGPRHLRGLAHLLSSLRKEKFDVAINMRTLVSWRGALKISLLFCVISPRISVGRNTDGRGFFFDLKIVEHLSDLGRIRAEKHEMVYDLETVRLLGADDSAPDSHLDLRQEEADRVKVFLRDRGIQDSDVLIGLHIGGLQTRRWPLDRFAEVIEGLNREGYSHFVVIGQKSEAALFGELQSKVTVSLIGAVGMTTFWELAALIQRCDLLITNDSGPMHIAAILQRPLIAIFTAGSFRYDPRFVSKNAAVFCLPSSCWPCYKIKCSSLDCLTRVPADKVLDTALKKLKGLNGCGEESEKSRVFPVLEKIYLWLRQCLLRPEERDKPSAGFWQESVRHKALDLCGGLQGRFLEIGCGEGLFLAALARKNPRLALYGIDSSSKKLQKAGEFLRQEGLEGIFLSKGDALSLPFEDGHFDSVACLNLFYGMSLERTEAILREVWRVLKPQGCFVFDFKNVKSPLVRLKYSFVDLYDSSLRKQGITLTMFDPKEVRMRVGRIGFRVLREEYLGFPFRNLAPNVVFEVRKG